MARLALLLLCIVLPVSAAWNEYKSGPFTLYADGDDKEARKALNHLEQFRNAVGQSFGRAELKTRWPILVLLDRTNAAQPFFGFGRAGYIINWPTRTTPGPEFWKSFAKILLDANLGGHMPEGIEEALVTLYSTLEVTGLRVNLGAPPPASEQSAEWARLHMLATNPETSGRLRVLLNNLASGAEEDASYRNAFEKPKAEIDKLIEPYRKAANFNTIALNSMPIDPERNFKQLPISNHTARVAQADLLLAQGHNAEARKAYTAILNDRNSPSAHEGMGLLNLADKDPASAEREFRLALETEGSGPRAPLELSRLEKDWPKAQQLLELALKKNPQWGLPWYEFSKREPGPNRKAISLQKAAQLEPRNTQYWRETAEAFAAANNPIEESKAWLQASRSAPTTVEREELAKARSGSDQRRADAEFEARRKEREEERADVERVKQEAMARIRAAEAKARGDKQPLPEGTKVEKWWDGPPTQKYTGSLERVECIGKQARLVLRGEDKKVTQLLIPDPKQILIMGGGQASFGCGAQKPPRKVVIEFIDKKNAKLATTGEAVTLEFAQP